MDKTEFEKIVNDVKTLGDFPNTDLINLMDKLSTEFDSVKQSIISTTYYLDRVEELYNIVFKEYQKRTK
jgi:hypothetical protein